MTTGLLFHQCQVVSHIKSFFSKAIVLSEGPCILIPASILHSGSGFGYPSEGFTSLIHLSSFALVFSLFFFSTQHIYKILFVLACRIHLSVGENKSVTKIMVLSVCAEKLLGPVAKFGVVGFFQCQRNWCCQVWGGTVLPPDELKLCKSKSSCWTCPRRGAVAIQGAGLSDPCVPFVLKFMGLFSGWQPRVPFIPEVPASISPYY